MRDALWSRRDFLRAAAAVGLVGLQPKAAYDELKRELKA